MIDDRQPSLPAELIDDANGVVSDLARSMSRQDAAILVHAGALAQHAEGVGLVEPGRPWRAALEHVSELHPGLAPLASLPGSADDEHIGDLWRRHRLMDPEGNIIWWSYPLGDLYQALSVEAVKNRALCQTPWWITELLIEMSYHEAVELELTPRAIDPCCGTGHILVELFHRAEGSHRVAPYVWHWPRIDEALDRVHGVDLDPYAVVIARWRLLVKAWAQIRHRGAASDLADLPLHVAQADTLLSTDEPLLTPASYHVVVANPPYITPRDRATAEAIRQDERYKAVCRGKFSLALPFHAKMMNLLAPGGWCAQLTSNAFMKREYGRHYIEDWLSGLDVRRIIDTSGVYIPGHGTPTVIMVHRNQKPVGDTVFTVRGIRREPKRPAVPAQGLVWTAIRDAVNARLSAERFAKGMQRAITEAQGTR